MNEPESQPDNHGIIKLLSGGPSDRFTELAYLRSMPEEPPGAPKLAIFRPLLSSSIIKIGDSNSYYDCGED